MTTNNVEGIAVRVLTPLVVPLLGMPKAPEGGQIYGGSGTDWVEIYSIETIDSLLAAKADITSVYSKSDADSIFATKTELGDLDDKVDSINADLLARINAVEGIGGYLPAYDFGTITPTQQELTDYALSVIPNITDPSQIFNGTRVKNINNNHLWILTNTPLTNPPVFEWADNGLDSVSQADNNGTLGVVTGSNVNLKIGISSDGTMSVNGLISALALKVDVGTVYTKAESDALLSNKANLDLVNTNFISDCILSAPNGIFSYSSGMTLSIKSLLKLLFPNGRTSLRTLASLAYQVPVDVPTTISGAAGDKVTVFMKQSDGTLFSVLSSKVAKGITPPADYEYFKNINTNVWQKKGAPSIDWTAGFGFSFGSPYQWVCSSKLMFAGQLIMQIAGRYQAAFPYRVIATSNGTSYTTLSASENWGAMAAANGILFTSAKGITTDLVNFSAVTMPSGFSLSYIYGVGDWFYLIDVSNKLFYKTQDFNSYTQLNASFLPPSSSYYPIGFDVDESGNIVICLAYTIGYSQYVAASQISKDGGQSWTSTGIAGTAVKAANGLIAIGTDSGGLSISSNQGTSWINLVIGTSRVYSIAFGGGEWNVALSTQLLITSQDNFATFSEKSTGFGAGGAPSLVFGNGLFFMTDFSSSSHSGWSSTSALYYAQPATQDENVIITDLLTCEINSLGSGLINIQPKYPDLFQMLGLVNIVEDIAKIKTELGIS